MLDLYDGQALTEWNTTVFNKKMIRLYRDCMLEECKNQYDHLEDEMFLEKIGAAYRLIDGRMVPTVAGVLMFADTSCIRNLFPNYFLDYQEETGSNTCSHYRITSDRGMQFGNILEFYLIVYKKLSNANIIHKENTLEPIMQIFANSIIHADYTGRRGVVIKVRQNEIEISNPGSILISQSQLTKGGISDPRNPFIFKMFSEMGGGDRAGMGIAEARRVWIENEWRGPLYSFEKNPDRVSVLLPFW